MRHIGASIRCWLGSLGAFGIVKDRKRSPSDAVSAVFDIHIMPIIILAIAIAMPSICTCPEDNCCQVEFRWRVVHGPPYNQEETCFAGHMTVGIGPRNAIAQDSTEFNTVPSRCARIYSAWQSHGISTPPLIRFKISHSITSAS